MTSHGPLKGTKDSASLETQSQTAQKKLSKSRMKELAREQAVRDAFKQVYTDIYGSERWGSLQYALTAPTRYSCLVNKYADPRDVSSALATVQAKLGWRPLAWLTGCQNFVVDSDDPVVDASEKRPVKVELPFPQPASDFHGIKTHYLLDAASVLATEALNILPDHTVLDMCAAPGGKSLCIAQRLGPNGHLVANEMSVERRKRLKKVLREYIPEVVFDRSIEVFGEDSSKRGAFTEGFFDRVLCDAPCSSERHLLHDEEELKTWTPSRTKNLAKRQVPLLLQAIRSAKDHGGRIVYATCSLSPSENDHVIEKALRKSKIKCEIRTHDQEWGVGEATKYGWIVLPDTIGRWGPLFFSVIEKVGPKEPSKRTDEVFSASSDDDHSQG